MSGVSVSVTVVAAAAAVLYRKKTTTAFLKLFFMCFAIFISAMQFAAGIEREKKKSSFEFLKMIMHNLSIYYNYLCDSMQFSNAFEVEICELCFEAQNGNAGKKQWCDCVFFHNSIKMCCVKM